MVTTCEIADLEAKRDKFGDMQVVHLSKFASVIRTTDNGLRESEGRGVPGRPGGAPVPSGGDRLSLKADAATISPPTPPGVCGHAPCRRPPPAGPPRHPTAPYKNFCSAGQP